MSEQHEIAALFEDRLFDAMHMAGIILTHLRKQGWQTPELAKREADVYRRNVEALLQAERERDALQVRIDRADGALADAATVQTDDLERGIHQLTKERDALQAECQRLTGQALQ